MGMTRIIMCSLKNSRIKIEDNVFSIQGTTFEKSSIKGCHVILKNRKANFARKEDIMCFNKSD